MSTKDLVFFIDDEPDLIMSYSTLMSEAYDVEVFESAEAALSQILKGQTPSVIVSDLNMPKMSGLEFSDRLKQIGQVIPVVLLSGYLDKELSIQALNHGVYGVMEKPVQLKQLREIMSAAIGDFHKVMRERKFKDSANQFVHISKNIIENYRYRFQESERLLKGLGLLPHNPGQDMKEIFGTEDLEKQMDSLVKHLADLDDQRQPALVMVKKAA